MTASRRQLLLTAAAAGLAGATPLRALAAAGPVADARLSRLLDAFVEEMLIESPTTTTSLGLDKGARAPLKRPAGRQLLRGPPPADRRLWRTGQAPAGDPARQPVRP
jgi:hypothetical protein